MARGLNWRRAVRVQNHWRGILVRATAEAGSEPAKLARQALNTLTIPGPTTGRYPGRVSSVFVLASYSTVGDMLLQNRRKRGGAM
jgi:hypothetical protein